MAGGGSRPKLGNVPRRTFKAISVTSAKLRLLPSSRVFDTRLTEADW
jgi:hypothetical protein